MDYHTVLQQNITLLEYVNSSSTKGKLIKIRFQKSLVNLVLRLHSLEDELKTNLHDFEHEL